MELRETWSMRVGALLRREVRRYLMSSDLEYREDKGLLDSVFVVRGSRSEYDKMRLDLASLQD